MGPVRRRLKWPQLFTAIIVAATPSMALASSCAQARPNWTPGTEVSAMSEAMALFSSPLALILLIASVISLRFRSQWGSLIVVVLWTALVSILAFTDIGGRAQGMAEGCIGSPSMFIALVVALCVGMILYTSPRPQKG